MQHPYRLVICLTSLAAGLLCSCAQILPPEKPLPPKPSEKPVPLKPATKIYPVDELYPENFSGHNYTYIDAAGRQAFDGGFAGAAHFSEGFAAVKGSSESYLGYIDTTGKLAIAKTLVAAHPFREERASIAVEKEGRTEYSYIGRDGAVVIPGPFGDARNFSEGLAAVKIKGQWGFVDRDGKLVIPAKFFSVGDFSEGLAAARTETKFGFIDKTGAFHIQPQFIKAGRFAEGLAAACDTNGLMGYIDHTGKFKIPGDYRAVAPFSEGLAWVERRNRTSAFIDKFGAPVFERRASSMSLTDVDTEQHTFRNGLCLVFDENGKFGFINPKGEYVIPPQFDEAAPFRGPLAKVLTPQGPAYINKSGQKVFPEK